MFQRLAHDAVPNDGDWNSEKCLEECLALNSISRFLDSCCVSIWVIALLEKGLKPWQMGISLKEKCQRRFLSKLIFGIIVFYMTKNGDLWFDFQKNISPFFVGNCHFNHLIQRLRNRHRCSALHAPRRPSVQPHWLEHRPPPGGIKKINPRDPGMKRWT